MDHEQLPFVPYNFERYPADEMQQRASEFYKHLNTRRSVRSFSGDPIPDGVIEDIVRTAGTAPSGAHKQPWKFCVIRDKDIKHQIRVAAEKEEEENYKRRFPDDWLRDLAIFRTNAIKEYIDIAPVLIVVFKELYQMIDGEKVKNYYVNE